MEKQLLENVNLVNQVLRANVPVYDSFEARWTEDKDVQRLDKIYSKTTDKWVRDAENMANKITTTEKAVRRARAAVMCGKLHDKKLVEEITKTFLRRAVMLHVGTIDPRDLVKLRQVGAIQ